MRQTIKRLILLVVIALVIEFSTEPFALGLKDSTNYVKGQVIIKMKSDAPPDIVIEIRKDLDAKVSEIFFSGAQLWEIRSMTVKQALKKYKEHPYIKYIEPNYKVKAVD